MAKNVNSIFVLLSLGLFLFTNESDAQEAGVRIRNFSKQEYAAEMQNWSITNDQNGYIYAANNIGLLEFDGIEWNFYPAPNGTVIRAVAVDSENRIFTSGYREIGYWIRDNYGKLNYHSLNSLAEAIFSQNEEFWNIVISDGKVYFHSFTSIFIYDYQEFKMIRPGGLISSISSIRDEVYLHIYAKGLFKLSGSRLDTIISTPGIKQNMVQFMLPYGDSSILLGTSGDGIYLYNDGRLKPFLEEWREYFADNSINRGLIFKDGRIIIGTLLDGILIFNSKGELISHLNRDSGLQNNTVLGISITENNEIWLSLDQGIDFISFDVDPSYTVYRFEDLGAVYSAAIYKGNLYLCTNLGVFYRTEKEEKAAFRFIDGTKGQAWDCKIVNDELFIGHNTGTFIIKGNQAEKISDVNGGMDIIPYPGEDNLLLQSSYTNFVFYSKKNSKWKSQAQMLEFSELIRYIEIDHLNHMWAGHMRRGIYELTPGPDMDTLLSINYYGKEVFGKDYDIQVFKVENRIVFTTGIKLYTYDDLNDSIIVFDQLNDKLGESSKAHRIIPGPEHTYWMISNSTIALFRIFENSVEMIKEYPVGLFEDHLIIGYENIFPINENTAILCLDNGYAMLNANLEDHSESIENMVLELKALGLRGIRGSYEDLPLNKKVIKLPYKKNSLYLKYAFPKSPIEDVAFQTFIEGIDNDWSERSVLPEFSFERLPPGSYEISIRAINRWNKSSRIENVRIRVKFPWYLSQISFVIYGLLLIAIILIIRYYMFQRMKIRERNIKNVKEKELIRLRNEKLNAELSYRSQELANSTMSIINKNEFLLKLKNIVQRQKEELGTRYPDKYYREIVGRIDKNVSSMDDWKVFEFHFEKAHEKFLQKLMHKYPELTHGDLRLCAYLRLNLSTKEIAPLLRISIRGVENHRYKLRKKLQLDADENLTEFIMGF